MKNIVTILERAIAKARNDEYNKFFWEANSCVHALKAEKLVVVDQDKLNRLIDFAYSYDGLCDTLWDLVRGPQSTHTAEKISQVDAAWEKILPSDLVRD